MFLRCCGAEEAEAVVVVLVRRVVVVAVGRRTVARVVVPAPAAIHTVRPRRSSSVPPELSSPSKRLPLV